MKLYDHHWINKGCTVEILYGEHRSFNCVIKEFKVVSCDTSKPADRQGNSHFILDVYGEEISYPQTWLRLIEKPGYTRIKEGYWVENYRLDEVINND